MLGSTKSFDYVREHNETVNRLDVMVEHEPITADYAPGTIELVTQHDGSILRLRKIATHYDPSDRVAAMTYLARARGGRRDRHRPALCRSGRRGSARLSATRSTSRSTSSAPPISCPARPRLRSSTRACASVLVQQSAVQPTSDCHCEECSDEAVQAADGLDCFHLAALGVAMTCLFPDLADFRTPGNLAATAGVKELR